MMSQPDTRYRMLLKRAGVAIAVGFLVTLGLNSLAFVADKLEYPLLSDALIWPNTFLQSQVPLNNIGTAEKPIMEGTPLNFLAFIASIPLSWVIYSCVAYFWLSTRKRNS